MQLLDTKPNELYHFTAQNNGAIASLRFWIWFINAAADFTGNKIAAVFVTSCECDVTDLWCSSFAGPQSDI